LCFWVTETAPADYITINITAIFNILKFNRNKTAILTINQTGGLQATMTTAAPGGPILVENEQQQTKEQASITMEKPRDRQHCFNLSSIIKILNGGRHRASCDPLQALLWKDPRFLRTERLAACHYIQVHPGKQEGARGTGP